MPHCSVFRHVAEEGVYFSALPLPSRRHSGAPGRHGGLGCHLGHKAWACFDVLGQVVLRGAVLAVLSGLGSDLTLCWSNENLRSTGVPWVSTPAKEAYRRQELAVLFWPGFLPFLSPDPWDGCKLAAASAPNPCRLLQAASAKTGPDVAIIQQHRSAPQKSPSLTAVKLRPTSRHHHHLDHLDAIRPCQLLNPAQNPREMSDESGRFSTDLGSEWNRGRRTKFARPLDLTDADDGPSQSALGMPCVLAATPPWRQDETM